MPGRGRPPTPDVLTPAEWRVLRLVRQRKTNTAIAEELGLSLNTVKFHVANMLAKLQLSDREELARWKGSPRSFGKWFLGWPAFGAAVGTVGVVALLVLVLAGRSEPEPADATNVSSPAPLTPFPVGPPVGRIAFVGSEPVSEGNQLFMVAASGGPVTPLTSGPAKRFSPAWSPDGSAVAYLEVPDVSRPIVAGDSAVASLRVVQASALTALTLKENDVSVRPSPAVLERPSWRPDGLRLVVAVRDFLTSRVNADGTDYREERLGCQAPSWAPDGLHGSCSIAGAGGSGNNTIYITAVSSEFRTSGYGGEPVTSGWSQTYGGRGVPAHGLFNQDSTWFTWWTYDESADPSVWVVPVDTAGLPPEEPRMVATGVEPRWSPDGKRLVFATTTDLSFPPRLAPGGIVVYEPEGGKLITLVEGGSNRWPVWSPDSSQIAFVSDRDDPRGEVYVMNSDGSGVTRLTFNETAESQLDWGALP